MSMAKWECVLFLPRYDRVQVLGRGRERESSTWNSGDGAGRAGTAVCEAGEVGWGQGGGDDASGVAFPLGCRRSTSLHARSVGGRDVGSWGVVRDKLAVCVLDVLLVSYRRGWALQLLMLGSSMFVLGMVKFDELH